MISIFAKSPQRVFFSPAADAYIQELSAENLQLKAQFEESDIQALQNRLRWFERKYIESQNDVVREQARSKLKNYTLSVDLLTEDSTAG
jgi:hypothetical protein